MKRYTPEELAEVLRLHNLWLEDEEGGVRAYLAGAYLAGANLGRAYLDHAYLAGANLGRAYLDHAYLDHANLAGANLADACLDGANLVRANIASAYMGGAKGFKPFVCVNPIRSKLSTTTVFLTEDKIQCGCFDGTLEAFEAKVRKTHADNPLHLAEYLGLVEYVKVLRAAQPDKGEATIEAPAPFQQGQTVKLTDAAREVWPWAPTESGTVMVCADGWTRIDFPDRYLSAPDSFLEVVE